jgi:hypothetical protein
MKSIEGIKTQNFKWISWANYRVMYYVLWSKKNVLFQHNFLRQMWGGWDDK